MLYLIFKIFDLFKLCKFYTLPRFESLESGFTLDFNSKANWDLQQFKLEFYKFGFFHAIFVMFLWSFIRTIIYDPGSLSLEYVK